MNTMHKHTLQTLFVLLLSISILTSPIFVQAQNKYWVSLSDKNGVEFDPYTYFTPEALERRAKQHLPVNDPSDWPLNEEYVDCIKSLSEKTGLQSRWLNALVVYAYPKQMEEITALPFVSSCEKMIENRVLISGNPSPEVTKVNIDLARKQLQRMQGPLFVQKELNGKGIRIAVFDIGFKKADTHLAFEHLRKKNSIVKTWDFVDEDENVYHYNSHGTMVLSCIAGKMDSLPLGLATEATFLLARTEKNSEKFAEEENWLAAAEWADKNGAHIISSSLGYTKDRYFNDQMDGKSSLVAKAATMAAKKGILVVNAAGNSGKDNWYYIGTPGDADSVLTVGGIDPDKDYHIDFSSFGPTSDGRMKPNVCAFGSALTARNESLSVAFGTSFATPLVAGFAACAWQSQPEWTNMQLFRALEKSADLYPYYDYAHGFGVPQASFFTDKAKRKVNPTFYFEKNDSLLKIKAPLDPEIRSSVDNDLLFYNFQNKSGVLTEYAVVKVYQEEALQFDLTALRPGTRINVWYRGFYDGFDLE
jgi:serine protease AprX